MRRHARILAVQTLYQFEFSGLTQSHFGATDNEFANSAEMQSYAQSVVEGFRAHQSKIDPLIQGASQKWSLERMNSVDRNILRVAVFEMFFATPVLEPGVAINEAIEIAKQFGTADSKAFVNGILDQIAREKKA